MDKIITYSLTEHRKIFAQPESPHEFLFVERNQFPIMEEPYRAESFAIGFMKEGSIEMQAGLTHFLVEAPSMIAMGPAVIRSFRNAGHKINMEVIFFTAEFFLKNQADVFFLTKYAFFEDNGTHAIKINAGQATVFDGIFQLIKNVFHRKEAHYQDIIRSYLYALIYELDALEDADHSPENNLSSLPRKFRNVLSKQFHSQRSVGFYAGQLNVTPKYLSEVMKRSTGKTAKEWIDETVLLEAKILLQNKSLTISQVSDQLNFSEPSVFGKFFKTGTGASPLEYRKCS